jgi:hypothetical protein
MSVLAKRHQSNQLLGDTFWPVIATPSSAVKFPVCPFAAMRAEFESAIKYNLMAEEFVAPR